MNVIISEQEGLLVGLLGSYTTREYVAVLDLPTIYGN